MLCTPQKRRAVIIMVHTTNRELTKAVVKNDVTAALHLLTHGADPNGNLFLHYAKEVEMIRILLDFGCRVNATNKYGDTALHVAVASGKGLPIVKELMKERPTINVRNWKGNTPLHVAVRRNDRDMEVIKELLLNGADINIKNYERQAYGNAFCSPLDYAVSNVACAKLLIKITLIRNLEQGYKDIVDVSIAQKHGTYEELSSYIEACISEIERMRTDFMKERFSLFHFMIPRYALIQSMFTTAEEQCNICDWIFALLADGKYLIYNDTIFSQLKKLYLRRPVLLKQLKNIQLYTNLNSASSVVKGKKVVLDIYSTYTIGRYLNEEEIINLIIAFYHPNKKNSEILGKDKEKC